MSAEDTYVCNKSHIAAMHAAAVVCNAVDVVMHSMKKESRNSESSQESDSESSDEKAAPERHSVFCLVRPPGHHVGRYGRTTGCCSHGFCLLNNVAIGVAHARVQWNLRRVAIFDFDVHFGNGTYEIFKDDGNVFFSSLHLQSDPTSDVPFFASELPGADVLSDSNCCISIPGLDRLDRDDDRSADDSDASDDNDASRPAAGAKKDIAGADAVLAPGTTAVGEADASRTSLAKISCGPTGSKGAVANSGAPSLPTAPRGREAFRIAFEQSVLPRLRAFDPELIFLSSGFDGHEDDPLGGAMRLTVDDIEWMTHHIVSLAEDPSMSTAGRVISVLEGGYDTHRDALARCVVAHVDALASPSSAQSGDA